MTDAHDPQAADIEVDETPLDEIPEEYRDPEGDAELQDPALMFESKFNVREEWKNWFCAPKKGKGKLVHPKFFGKNIGGIPEPAADAYRALEMALRAAGYEPGTAWSNKCRKIANSKNWSLHSYGIAIDIDAKKNPHAPGNKFSGKMKAHHVESVEQIKNKSGRRIWSWGGHWSKPDRMHYQLALGPADVDVDWSTVPGADGSEIDTVTSGTVTSTAAEDNVLAKPAEGKAVKLFQKRLMAWNSAALPKFGADGDYGGETEDWVKKFQSEFGLPETGAIDGITANLLMRT